MAKFRALGALGWASIVVAVLLVVSLGHMPYGYYTVMRWATAIVLGCWAYRYSQRKMTAPAIIAVGALVIYQPILKVAMDRDTWHVLDVVLAVALIVATIVEYRR